MENHTRMDECILVCVYYGPNGERLIRRGCKIASMQNCPLYILTVDPLPEGEMDIEKIRYIAHWRELAEQYGAEFIIHYNEKRPAAKVIGDIVRQKHVTQIVLGQTAQSRWKEITKGSFINVLLHEIPFVDLHVVSVSRDLDDPEGFYETGVRAFIVKDPEGYHLCFNHTHEDQDVYEGIFYKEVGTDFNNGVFKFMKDNHELEVNVRDDQLDNLQQQIAKAAQKAEKNDK